ncbi:hypothetical protein DCC81_13670 [Chitinophaga parva]|uniref:Cadherin domain-containing protein n=1 Tax=Chitinophaga parva TaxID=2169414 RepID=A0A2T7BGD2_9BACT|nr:Ig-like domain-containing protein [Chitinophaga parva]PUZ25346.1 hypothetical protein DCC81_13670 [Chitinophaga parva]
MKRTFTRHFPLFLLFMLLSVQHVFAVAPYPLQRWMHAVMPHDVAAPSAKPHALLAPATTDVSVYGDNFHYGTDIPLYVTFSEPINVNLGLGPITLDISMSDGTSRTFVCVGRDPADNTSLEMHYTVQDGDFQDSGNLPFAAAVVAPAGAITSLADGTPVDLSTAGATDDTWGNFVSGVVPHVVLTPDPLPAKVSGTFTVTATFSPESMIGVTQSIFTATNATLSAFQDNVDGQHKVFAISVTPIADGPLTVSIPANMAANIQSNYNFASNVLTATVDQTAPSITSVDVPPDDYYNATNTLQFTVHFSENVFVTGTPVLYLNIGGTPVQATYTSGTGSSALLFSYHILDGQADADGITIDSLGLNGSATIGDDTHNNANLTLNGVPSTAGVKVNTTHPTVTLTTAAPAVVNGPFNVTATFSEWVSGLDAFDFTIVNGSVNAPTTSDNITYTFQVVPATPDQPVSITLPADKAENIGHNGNLASNTISLQFDPTAPAITVIEGPANATYIAGQDLTFKVVFSEKVNVTGVPYLDLNIGGTTVQAQYQSGTGDSVLYFKYTVVDGNHDADGIGVTAANAGTGTIKDIATNDADLTINPAVVADLTGVLVNTQHPAVTITGPSTSASSVNVTITFSEAMGAVDAGKFILGGTVTGTSLTGLTTLDNITYTGTLNFPANVTGTVTLSLPADVVKSAVGNNNQASNVYTVNVDNAGPVVTAVSGPADKTYRQGEQLQFTVTFNEPVTVDQTGGTPQLPIIIGSSTVWADYVSGTGTTQLVFSYTVLPNQYDADGVTTGTDLAANGGTLQDALGNDASLTLHNVAATTGVLVNARIPSVTLGPVAPGVTGPFTVTATFSEKVTGFDATDVTLVNGTAGTPVSSDGGKTYTFTVTPAADGTVSVTIPANAAFNTGNNGNTASNTITTTADVTAPYITSVDVPAPLVYNSSMVLTFQVHFSENAVVTNVPGLPIDIGGQTREAIYTGGTGTDTWSFAYLVQDGDQDMDGITLGTALDISTSIIRDAAGNDADVTLHNVGNTTGVKVNTAHPTVTLSGAPASAHTPFTITATFSEVVTGLAVTDFSAPNGATFSNLQSADGITYTVLVTPTADGTLTISLPANIAVNVGNNGNLASNTLSSSVDVSAPAVTSVDVPANATYKTGQVLNFTVHFSEVVNVTGNPALPITIGTQTVLAAYTGGAGTTALTFAYTILDGQMDLDGIALAASLLPNGATIQDAATNNANLTLNNVAATNNVLVNTSHPTVVITGPATASGTFTATVTFSAVMTGVTLSDFAVTNGTLSNLVTTDDVTYTVDVTPAADGSLTLMLPADVAQNSIGSGNQASNTLSVNITLPVPEITQVDVPVNGTYTTGQDLTFTVHFSEVVNVTGTPALPVTIGTQTVLATYVSGTGSDILTFSYTVLDGQMDLDGISLATSLLPNGATIRDAAARDADFTLHNVASTTNVLVNTHLPTVVISGPATISSSFTATITFSEAMTGLTLSDFLVSNATLTNLTTTDGIVYTVDVTPVADGSLTLQLPANVAVNTQAAGNKASNILTVTADLAVPVITQVDVPADNIYNAGSVLTFTVHYSENVAITGTPKLPIIIGTQPVQASYVSGSGTNLLVFTYTVQNGDLDMDGIALGSALILNGGSIKDGISNDGVLTLNNIASTANVLVNTAHPTVVISSPAPTVTAPFSITITFSEAVTGFTSSDFVLTNATVSNLQTSDNKVYTALVIPGAAGTLSIDIPADVAMNAANNGNTASNTVSTMVDFNAPYITQVNVPADNTYHSGDVLSFSVTFNKGVYVTGTPSLDIIIGAKTAQATLVSGSGTGVLTFNYTVVDGDYDMDGIALTTSLNLNGGTITDANSNNADVTVKNAASTSNIFVNAIRPSVVLTGTGTGSAPFTITITFSEAVTGLTAADFAIVNATGSNLQTTDNKTYTLLITPGGGGTITINLPANMAQNAGGNGNTASNTLSISVGSPAPVINTPPAFQAVEHSPVGTAVGTLTATASTGTLQQWTITSDNSGGAFQIDPNTGEITVKDVTLLDAKVYSTVTLTVTVSDGFNTSAPATVHISVTPAPAAVNQAPILDAVTDKQTCAVPAKQSIQLTGGSPVEAGQQLTYTISADKDFFTALTINNSGLISYTLKPNTTGKVNFTVVLKDDGGTANGGVDSLRVTFALTINALPDVSISADKEGEINQGESLTLTADAPGASQYAWNTGAEGRQLNVQPSEDTTYMVTASTGNGCTSSASYNVRVKPAPDTKITATNFLTPNGDGRNDRWIVTNLQNYGTYDITIFDRAGRIVYYTRNYNNDWGGTANGDPLAEGTYYYVINVQGQQPVKGFVTIVRDIKK